MKIPMYFGDQFISYCNFPNKDYYFNCEMTLEEVVVLFGKQNAEEIIQQARHLSETTTLTFQGALNQILKNN